MQSVQSVNTATIMSGSSLVIDYLQKLLTGTFQLKNKLHSCPVLEKTVEYFVCSLSISITQTLLHIKTHQFAKH